MRSITVSRRTLSMLGGRECCLLDLLVAGVRAADSMDELVAVLRRAKIPVRPGRARGNDAAELRTLGRGDAFFAVNRR